MKTTGIKLRATSFWEEQRWRSMVHSVLLRYILRNFLASMHLRESNYGFVIDEVLTETML